MSLRIKWTPVALQSLSEVLDYTFEEFGERQLQKLTKLIYSTTYRLAAFPLSGKFEPEITDSTGIEYRSMAVISEIKILYTTDDDTLYVEFVKNVRLDDATMLARFNEQT